MKSEERKYFVLDDILDWKEIDLIVANFTNMIGENSNE